MTNEPILVRDTIDEDGDVHHIYQLPTPIAWKFTRFVGDTDLSSQESHLVNRVRVCLCLSDVVTGPIVIIVPYGKDGQEAPLSAKHFKGAQSMQAGLSRIGFPPVLDSN